MAERKMFIVLFDGGDGHYVVSGEEEDAKSEAIAEAHSWVVQRISDFHRHKGKLKATPELIADFDIQIYRLGDTKPLELPWQEWFDEDYAMRAEQAEWDREQKLRSYAGQAAAESALPLQIACLDPRSLWDPFFVQPLAKFYPEAGEPWQLSLREYAGRAARELAIDLLEEAKEGLTFLACRTMLDAMAVWGKSRELAIEEARREDRIHGRKRNG